jgi:hypothetical protein
MKTTICTLALMLASFSLLVARPAVAQGTFDSKLWVVSPEQAADVTFPAPSATPDATFSTNGIAYIGGGNGCYTIEKWVSGCETPAYNLAFSGLPNPNLRNKAAKAGTKMTGPGYGIIVEFIGTVQLTNGQPIYILHDDGVSLMIDGSLVSGYDPFTTVPVLESVTFTGTTGPHSVDLLYANSAGNPNTSGAWLLFMPKLF